MDSEEVSDQESIPSEEDNKAMAEESKDDSNAGGLGDCETDFNKFRKQSVDSNESMSDGSVDQKPVEQPKSKIKSQVSEAKST